MVSGFTRCGTQTSVKPCSRVWRSSMSCTSARLSRDAAPHITVKRDLAILLARSKSRMPRASPISKCCFASKANCRGAPQRHARVGQVGHLEQQALEPRVHLLHEPVENLDALRHLAHARHGRLRILAAPLGLPDGLGRAIAL